MDERDKGRAVHVLKAAFLLALLVGLHGCGKDFSRDQFTQLALHKTEAEVQSALGKPSWVSEAKPKTWIYYHKTYDAKNQNKEDYRASLKFAPDPSGQERVTNVEFSATAGST